MNKKGSVVRVDTDHVLIGWDDGSRTMWDLSDANGKTLSQGDKVTYYPPPPGPDHWWTLPRLVVDQKPDGGD